MGEYLYKYIYIFFYKIKILLYLKDLNHSPYPYISQAFIFVEWLSHKKMCKYMLKNLKLSQLITVFVCFDENTFEKITYFLENW